MIANAEGLKVCAKCKIPKEPKYFYNLRQELDGLDYYCKYCRNRITLAWRRANPEKLARGALAVDAARKRHRYLQRKIQALEVYRARGCERTRTPIMNSRRMKRELTPKQYANAYELSFLRQFLRNAIQSRDMRAREVALLRAAIRLRKEVDRKWTIHVKNHPPVVTTGLANSPRKAATGKAKKRQ